MGTSAIKQMNITLSNSKTKCSAPFLLKGDLKPPFSRQRPCNNGFVDTIFLRSYTQRRGVKLFEHTYNNIRRGEGENETMRRQKRNINPK